MRKFVHINANDYFGDNKPEGQYIEAKDEYEALKTCGMAWFDDDHYWQEMHDELGVDISSNESKLAYLKKNYVNGDGAPCEFLFEIIDGEMELILG